MSESKQDRDDSYPVPDKDDFDDHKDLRDLKFSYFEPLKGITFAVVATIIFLGFPQIITYVFVGTRLIPTFDAEVVRSLWLPIILWAVFRVGIDVAYIIERHYTKRLAIITIIGDVLAAICGIIIFINQRIVYWEYIDFIHTYFEDMAEWFSVPLTAILDKPNLIILVLMIFFFVLECFAVVRKAKRAEELEDEDDKVVSTEVNLNEITPDDADAADVGAGASGADAAGADASASDADTSGADASAAGADAADAPNTTDTANTDTSSL